MRMLPTLWKTGFDRTRTKVQNNSHLKFKHVVGTNSVTTEVVDRSEDEDDEYHWYDYYPNHGFFVEGFANEVRLELLEVMENEREIGEGSNARTVSEIQGVAVDDDGNKVTVISSEDYKAILTQEITDDMTVYEDDSKEYERYLLVGVLCMQALLLMVMFV